MCGTSLAAAVSSVTRTNAHRLAQLPFADDSESLRVLESGNRAFPSLAAGSTDDRHRHTALDRRGHDPGGTECLVVGMGEDRHQGLHQTNSPVRTSACSSRAWRALPVR